MSLLIAILCILFFGAVLLLVILNPATTELNLFFRAYPQVPVAVVMVASLLTGIVFTCLISIIDGIRMRVQNRRLRREVTRLEDEVEHLRRPAAGAWESDDPDRGPPVDFPRS